MHAAADAVAAALRCPKGNDVNIIGGVVSAHSAAQPLIKAHSSEVWMSGFLFLLCV